MGQRLVLGPRWTREHEVARPLRSSRGHRDSSKRERRSSGFSPMASLGGEAAHMATQQCSTEATGGSPMG
jgi:hypothetical protein